MESKHLALIAMAFFACVAIMAATSHKAVKYDRCEVMGDAQGNKWIECDIN